MTTPSVTEDMIEVGMRAMEECPSRWCDDQLRAAYIAMKSAAPDQPCRKCNGARMVQENTGPAVPCSLCVERGEFRSVIIGLLDKEFGRQLDTMPEVSHVGEPDGNRIALEGTFDLEGLAIAVEHLIEADVAARIGLAGLDTGLTDVERVARTIAPRIFYEFDGETMDRAANWEAHSEQDRETMRLIAQDAIAAMQPNEAPPLTSDNASGVIKGSEQPVHADVERVEQIGAIITFNRNKSSFEIAKAICAALLVSDRSGVERVEWRCFHCDELFADRRCAEAHFGPTEDSQPACLIKAGAEGSLVRALRSAERDCAEMNHLLHDESSEAFRLYASQQSRHHEQLRAAEEAGYERGLADARTALNPPTIPEKDEQLQPCVNCNDPDCDFDCDGEYAEKDEQ